MPWVSCMVGVLLCLVTFTPLEAADIRYVNSPTIDLNMRRGPGTEHAIVTRLPHGTAVTLHERVGLWYRITPLNSQQEGWVLRRYLTMKPPSTDGLPEDLNSEHEQQRFSRLERKGVLRLYTDNAQVLRILIDPLIWQRLNAQQHANFLQRAHRLYGNQVVEMRNAQNDVLLNRLTVTGDTFTLEGPEELAPASSPSPEQPTPLLAIPPLPNRPR